VFKIIILYNIIFPAGANQPPQHAHAADTPPTPPLPTTPTSSSIQASTAQTRYTQASSRIQHNAATHQA